VAERITVVGLPNAQPLPPASLVVGGRRHLEAAGLAPGTATVLVGGDLGPVLAAIETESGPVCVLASGDPGFFGIVRVLAARFGPGALEVRPAPSSVSLAFARLGLPWDDAVVVSAHGRPLSSAASIAAAARKAAVLVSPAAPPEALGKELLALGAEPADVAVCSQLGFAGESVTRTDLAGLAAGTWDPVSVVVVLRGDPVAAAAAASFDSTTTRNRAHECYETEAVLSWGRPEAAFAHRAGMVTKPEVRAVVLSRLALPATGVLWDVGAGSGSVAIEAALVCPALRVFAVERRPDDAERIEANAAALGARLTVVRGEAPGALAELPDPDRAFVGGGGLAVLDQVLGRLRPGGRLVATFAALDRAAAAADRLGHLTQMAVSRGAPLPDGGWRLAADNPVFVVWGPNP
jgi:precorrin-6B C5,15-methyltransferase / cobalt-precorrin-6B C5,C15-methyltransferase